MLVTLAAVIMGACFYYYYVNRPIHSTYEYMKKPHRSTVYLNGDLVKKYPVLAREDLYKTVQFSNENSDAWPEPTTLSSVDYLADFNCVDKKATLLKYTYFKTGVVGGWGSLSAVDCGDYYFVLENGDAGTKLYGPFDFSDTTSAIVSSDYYETGKVTSEWKSYSNSKFDFSLKYPKDWSIDESFDGKSISLNSHALIRVESGVFPRSGLNISVVPSDSFSQETRYGTITYNKSDRSFYSDSDWLDGVCISNFKDGQYLMPYVLYGGSGMATPSYANLALITNRDYILAIMGFGDFDDVLDTLELNNGLSYVKTGCANHDSSTQ